MTKVLKFKKAKFYSHYFFYFVEGKDDGINKPEGSIDVYYNAFHRKNCYEVYFVDKYHRASRTFLYLADAKKYVKEVLGVATNGD